MSAAAEPAASREDLLALIAVLREQNAALAERCALLEERGALLEDQNAQLAAANERLTKRVAELERRLGRNSGNSNFPPSQDVFGLPKDEKPESKPKSEARRGKRKGAPGTGLGMVESPDKVRNHRPRACGDCGTGLRGIPSVGFARRQVSDIPLVTVKVTEHRLHKVRCDCGHTTTAEAPAGLAGSPASYGPNLRALAVYLVVFHHVPVERTARLICDLTGASVSTGWVNTMVAEAAGLTADSLNLIKALLVLGHILHADETTTRISGKRRWLHVACTDFLTHLALAPRSREGANSLGILPAFRGTLVHDSLSLYAGYPGAAHQLCGAHLIRELTAAEQDHPKQKWHQQIRWALAGLNRQAQRVRGGGIPGISPQSLLFYLQHYHRGVTAGLALHPRAPGRKQSPARNLLERLRDQAGDVLRFADHPRHVPFTNNTGERALRPVKTQVKISGCHQSDTGAAAWLAVRSYLDSARKHGLNAFDAIHRAFTGNLWMPPIALGT
ncbi:IS66 family transposase [Actinacidiphila soli]|uniref:IS66 family transposase n=1 Tax=Actinacidiphila soli TaxID=2487275 RepID=UPI000FCB5DCB|nr:IS66 family transposase [Actinacidiphila soli]